ncbi:MAG: hypothetical protein C0506_15145 [Anaerolinea sp.]|nr:hypothetical protein [Anaerolinea sp.]
MALPTEFAEPPRRVRFKSPVPGIEITDGRQVWAVALVGDIQFSGGPRGFVPHPQSKGTYAVAFSSEETGRIEYAVAGERVLD